MCRILSQSFIHQVRILSSNGEDPEHRQVPPCRNPLFIKSEFSLAVTQKKPSPLRGRNPLFIKSEFSQVQDLFGFILRLRTPCSRNPLFIKSEFSLEKEWGLGCKEYSRNPLFIKSEFSRGLCGVEGSTRSGHMSQSFIHQVRILSEDEKDN